MNKQTSTRSYFKEAESWANDRQAELRASRRVAWMVALGAAVIALVEGGALIILMPLKTVVPYTLLVDRHTGYVQALRPLEPQTIAPDTALTRSFLVQYVIAREGFDINALQADYRKVALWSADDARSSYVAGMQAGNPESPLAKYPRTSTVDVQVKSVNAVAPNVALVRYDTQRHDAGGAVGPVRSWATVIRYAYSSAPMSTADRMINPLGFKVASFHRSAETAPMAEPAPNQANSAPGIATAPARAEVTTGIVTAPGAQPSQTVGAPMPGLVRPAPSAQNTGAGRPL